MDADFHFHVCEWCGTSFSHHKSKIAAGQGHEAHQCPACGKQVNTKTYDKPAVLDVKNWYGVGGKARKGGRK